MNDKTVLAIEIEPHVSNERLSNVCLSVQAAVTNLHFGLSIYFPKDVSRDKLLLLSFCCHTLQKKDTKSLVLSMLSKDERTGNISWITRDAARYLVSQTNPDL